MRLLRRRHAAALILIAGLMSAAPPAGAAAKPYRIAGAVRGEDRKWTAVEVLEETQLGVSCQIKYLDAEGRRSVLASSVGTSIDVFPVRSGDGSRPSFLVFVLEMTNNSSENVAFNPAQARMATDKGDMKFAMDYTKVYERLQVLGGEAPGVDDVAKVLFDRVVTLRPGGSARKLLVFEAPREDRYKTMLVRLVEVDVGTNGVDFVFPFRKFAP